MLTFLGSIPGIADAVMASIIAAPSASRAAVDARVRVVGTSMAVDQGALQTMVQEALGTQAAKEALLFQRPAVTAGSLDSLTQDGLYPIISTAVTGLPVNVAGTYLRPTGANVAALYITAEERPRLFARRWTSNTWGAWWPIGVEKGQIPGTLLADCRWNGLWEVPGPVAAQITDKPAWAGSGHATLRVTAMTATAGTVTQEWAQTDSGLTRKAERTAPSPGGAFGDWVETTVLVTPSKKAVVCLGDSLTQGYGPDAGWPASDAWPAKLQAELGIPVLNYGRTGDTSDQMMIRTGLHQLTFRVPGGVIPADTTPVSVETGFVRDWPSTIYFGGALAGVTGTLRLNTDMGWTFARSTAGAAVSVTEAEFVGSQKIGTQTVILWIGRNDLAHGTGGMEGDKASHVVANTLLAIERLAMQHKNVLVAGVTERTVDTAGSGGLQMVRDVNDRLRYLMPGKFADVQQYLSTKALSDMGVTPTTEDTKAMSEGRIPPQLFNPGDVTHFTKAAAANLAKNFFAPWLRGRGWV